jgi:hypothetical protein
MTPSAIETAEELANQLANPTAGLLRWAILYHRKRLLGRALEGKGKPRQMGTPPSVQDEVTLLVSRVLFQIVGPNFRNARGCKSSPRFG